MCECVCAACLVCLLAQQAKGVLVKCTFWFSSVWQVFVMYSVQSGPKGRLLYGFLSYENIRYRGSFKPKCGKCLFFSVGSFVRSFTSPFLRFCFSNHLFYLSVLLYSLDSSSSISQFVIQSITTKHGRGLLWTRTKKKTIAQSVTESMLWTFFMFA